MKNIGSKVAVLILVLLGVNINSNAGFFIKTAKSGVQDKYQESLIQKYNTAQRLRNNNDFKSLVNKLENERLTLKPSDYGFYRVLNELANIYSYHLLDIEKAISIDEMIVENDIIDEGKDKFVPTANVANQVVLASSSYIKDFIDIPEVVVKSNAQKRLLKNRKLLNGVALNKNSKYDRNFLENHLNQINNDFNSVPKNSPNYNKLLSRLIRAEYELYLIDPNYKIQSHYYFDTNFSYDNVDFSEINYIDFANYLVAVYEQTNNISYANQALKTIYKPYVNLRNPEYRLNYNNLINQYIALLIDAHYQKGNYKDMLYYVSLNKSRMILEERLAYTSDNKLQLKISDLTVNDGISRDEYGLPTKQGFYTKLAQVNNYLDMYVDNSNTPLKAVNTVHSLANQKRPTRGLIRQSFTDIQQPVNNDEKVYITHIKDGEIISAKRLEDNNLLVLKDNLDKSYQQILNQSKITTPGFSHFLGISDDSNNSALVISPDKWLTKYPYDFILNSNTIRSINLLTHIPHSTILSDIQITGFFNPTLDLAGTEYEAKIIKEQFPNSDINIGNQAKLKTLNNKSNNNVIHLSMHGVFNEQNPVYSKLLFNGANKAVDTDDSNSLYAKDIFQYQALKNQDLVFTAACQTGITSNAQKNLNEMVGILRPLVANGNKNLILSLWDVDDIATSLFVDAFYRKLSSSRDIEKSFSYAQSIVKQKYKDPYYWSAFYLLKTA